MRYSQFSVSGNILTLTIRSAIDAARFKAICREMDHAVATLRKIRLVLVMRHYPSLNSAEDFYDDLRFLRGYHDAIDRVAVVCDRSWKSTWVGLFGLFSGIRMACFTMDETDALTRWLQDGAHQR